jgi:phage protein D
MTTLKTAAWVLVWRGKDVTADLKTFVSEINYSDELADKSDELTIVLEDRDGLFRGDWWPERGDIIELSLGCAGEGLARIGSFEIDEVSFSGPPDQVSLRCLAAGVKSSLRTRNDEAYEEITLREIARQVAERNHLELVGGGENTGRSYARTTQRREADLAFLNRLGRTEGIIFQIKDRQLVWHDQSELDQAAAVIVIERTKISSYGLKLAASVVYQDCTVSYHDAEKKELIEETVTASGIPSGESLSIVARCENREQAQAKAAAALRRANGGQLDGELEMPGNPLLRAGVNVMLNGWGMLDQKTQIIRAGHTVSRGGYTTRITVGIPSKDGAYES